MGDFKSEKENKIKPNSSAFAESLATNTGASLFAPAYSHQNAPVQMQQMNFGGMNGGGGPGKGFSAGIEISFKIGGMAKKP